MSSFDIFALTIFMFIPIASLAGGLVWITAGDRCGAAGAIGIISLLGFFFLMMIISV